MKKHLVLAAGLAVLSTNAFATKARMDALSQGANRGGWFTDSRSIFADPAVVNTLKNYVVTEWGTADYSTADTAGAPRAEGGIFKEAGSFVWGAYFGSDINLLSAIKNDSDSGTAGYQGYNFPTSAGTTSLALGEDGFLNPGNKLDLFFGGDTGSVQWGARLGYASDKHESGFEKSASAWQVGLGFIMGDLEVYSNLDLVNEAEGASTAGDKWEADLGINIGGTYALNGYTLWADFAKQGAEYTDQGSAANTWERTEIELGVGRSHEVNSGARLYTDVRLYSLKEEATVATVAHEYSGTFIPVVIGYEADATSWLVLRGSVKAHLLGNNKYTTANTTTKDVTDAGNSVAAGATLNFGKLKLDGSIGTMGTGTLHLDNLMTRVAAHYWF